MKKVLIVGLAPGLGGIETFVYNIFKYMNHDEIKLDFLVHSPEDCAYGEEFKKFGNIYHVTNFKSNPFKMFRELCNFYKHHKYDIIHCNIGSAESAVYVWPSTLYYKCTIISHAHCSGGCRLNRLFQPLQASYTDYYFSCSKISAEWLFGKKTVDEKEITYFKNGIDIDKYKFDLERRLEIRKVIGASDSDFVIGHTGRFSGEKNHLFLLNLFKEYSKKNNKAKLLLVGDGKLRAEIEKFIDDNDLGSKVFLAGFCDDVYNWYHAMDVFVLPSLYEGLGIVLVEAQASGLPCIVSENITDEVKLTETFYRMNLNDSIKSWYKILDKINLIKINRERAHMKIQNAGYDAKSTSEMIQRFYLKQ